LFNLLSSSFIEWCEGIGFVDVPAIVVTANRYDPDVLDNSGNGTGPLGALGKPWPSERCRCRVSAFRSSISTRQLAGEYTLVDQCTMRSIWMYIWYDVTL
jgi:hypothetical protein